jgi:hypothetical protein
MGSSEIIASIRPVHTQPDKQVLEGGTFVAIEFEANDADLVRLAANALELARDVSAAITLTSNLPLGNVAPVQLLETTPRKRIPRFLFFFYHAPSRWTSSITTDHVTAAQQAWRHWDGLQDGKRLRRATRRYAQALAATDQVEALQTAWYGLEALEKPLALEEGLTPGTEVSRGTCDSCGTMYERRTTTLVGVRAFITGQIHQLPQSPEREAEWKALSEVRAALVHSLKDLKEIETKVNEHVAAAFHYLHDASVHLSHLHKLEEWGYRLNLPIPLTNVIVGKTGGQKPPSLGEWGPLLEMHLTWIEHGAHGWIPEYEAVNQAGGEIGGEFFYLGKPLNQATEEDLQPANVEIGELRPGSG